MKSAVKSEQKCSDFTTKVSTKTVKMEDADPNLESFLETLSPTKNVKYEALGNFYPIEKHLAQNEGYDEGKALEAASLLHSTDSKNVRKQEWQRLAYLSRLEIKHLLRQNEELKAEKVHFQDAYEQCNAALQDVEQYYKSMAASENVQMSEERKQQLEEMSSRMTMLNGCPHAVSMIELMQKLLDDDKNWYQQFKFQGNHMHEVPTTQLLLFLLEWITEINKLEGIDLPTHVKTKFTAGEGLMARLNVESLAQFPTDDVSNDFWKMDPNDADAWKLQGSTTGLPPLSRKGARKLMHNYIKEVYDIISSWGLSDRARARRTQEYAEEKNIFMTGHASASHMKWDINLRHCERLLAQLDPTRSLSAQDPFDTVKFLERVPIRTLNSKNDIFNLPFKLNAVEPLTGADFERYKKLYEDSQDKVLKPHEWKELCYYLGQLVQLHYLRSCVSYEGLHHCTAKKAELERKYDDLKIQHDAIVEDNESKRVEIPTLNGVVEEVDNLTEEPYDNSEHDDLVEVAQEYLRDSMLREYESPGNSRIEQVLRHLNYLKVGLHRIIDHYDQTIKNEKDSREYVREIRDTMTHYYQSWKKAQDFWYTSLKLGFHNSRNRYLGTAIERVKRQSSEFTGKLETWLSIIRREMHRKSIVTETEEELEKINDTFNGVPTDFAPEYTLPTIRIEPESGESVPQTRIKVDPTVVSDIVQIPFNANQGSTMYIQNATPSDPIQEQKNRQASLAASNTFGQLGLINQGASLPSNRSLYDSDSDTTMKPFAKQLMDQHNQANRPYRKWKKGQINEKLSNYSDPQSASFFWTAFEESVEFTDITWMMKILELKKLVSTDLQNAITALPVNAGQSLPAPDNDNYAKRQYFDIKAMIKQRNSFNPMLHLQDKIERLDKVYEYPKLEILEKFIDALSTISSLVPTDMNIPHSPYQTKMVSRFEKAFFNRYQLFLKRNPGMTPTLSALSLFLDEEYATAKQFQQMSGPVSQSVNSHNPKPRTRMTSYATTTQPTAETKWCPIHQNHTTHWLTDCKTYSQMSDGQRKEALGNVRGICWKCCKPFHGPCSVETDTCKKCQRRHHKILPCPSPLPSKPKYNKYTPPNSKPRNQPPRNEEKTQEMSSNHAQFQVDSNQGGLSELTSYTPFTLAVNLENQKTGQLIPTILYQDNGLSHTIIHRDLAEEAGLEGPEEEIMMTTMKGTGVVKGVYTDQFALVSMDGDTKVPLKAMAMNKKPDYKHHPTMPIKRKYAYLKQCNFPTNNAKTIGVTVGRDQIGLLLPKQIIEGKPGQPIAILTKLGWSVTVPVSQTGLEFNRTTIQRITPQPVDIKNPNPSKPGESCPTTNDEPIELAESSKPGEQPISSADTELEKLENIENIWFKEPHVNQSVEQQKTLDALEASMQVDEITNEISVKIPFNDSIKVFKNNYNEVIPRQISNEKALERKGKDMYSTYATLIKDMVNQGYLEEIEDPEPHIGDDKVYIPHFAVYKDSLTTPVRIVFDARAKMRCGLSYNDCVATAPDLQQLLTDVFLSFRKGPYCWSLDVKKMFHQVAIYPEQRDQNRLIFREPGSSKFRVFRLRTWWMGNTCAPAAVQLAVLKTAERKKEELPLGHAVLTTGTYMDDSMGSYYTEKEALQAMEQTVKIFNACKMDVAKLTSNSTTIMKALPPEMRLKSWETGDLPETRILGHLIDSNKDTFSTPCDLTQTKCPTTKRLLLHLLASIYDPLGYHAPFLVLSRILLQLCWKRGLDWDEPLPSDIQSEVNKWYKQLPLLNEISFQRCLSRTPLKAISVFCDASGDAYGCVGYAIGMDGSSYIIASKGRVHSNKSKHSIPRKELLAAVLAAKMAETLKRNFPGVPITFWSDSTNVLSWLKNDWRKYHMFVANRVYYIQSVSDPKDWFWVPTALNPADLVSRGANLQDLKDNKFWLHGPAFLTDPNVEYPEKKTFGENKNEMKKTEMKSLFSMDNFATLLTAPDMDDFATIQELVTEMTRLRREKEGIDDESVQTLDENKAALKELIKSAQSDAYPDELADLLAKSPISRNSRIFQLCPILDEDGLIRLKTRLEHSETVPFDTKYPILLPPNHALTKLIILDLHDKTNHAYGNNYLLSELRTQYWVPKGIQQIKRVRKDCRQCQAIHAKPRVPQMAPLPLSRSSKPLKTFLHVGVDFTGHFLCKQGRGKAKEKRYVALFTCLHSRAVHLEMVSKLETSNFQGTLTRFAARRGTPTTIYCDNATNFHGAAREIKDLINKMDQDAISEYTRKSGFEFKWIPPRSPHMGGAWESLIKSAKRALRATLGPKEFTDWELYTALCQVEDIINSRPLCFVNSDPNDFSVLTPNMFLTGRQDNQVFPDSVDTTTFNASDPKLRWRYIMSASAHMWSRWQKEILPTIGTRSKWIQDNRNYEVLDECLLIDPSLPRYKWQPGRIVEVVPGRDGRVRSVVLRTETGEIHTNVHRLIPLS